LAKHNPLGLRIVKLTPASVREIAAEQTLPALLPVQHLADAGDVGRIGIGDVLSVSIFETQPALFSPTVGVASLGGAAAASASPQAPGATLTNIPPLEVAKDGAIDIPYGGHVRVAGLTPVEVERKIQGLLRNKSIMPQVIVGVSRNVTNTVLISGDVRSPGRFPLDLQAEHLLDMVTLAGGPLNSPFDETVELVRGDSSVKMILGEIAPLAPSNVVLSPGDRISLLHKPRTFTVFGSAGHLSEIDFKNPTVSLADGLARAAAATGYESDATGIYLFRFENPTVARKLGIAQSSVPVPVIYRVNLMDPTSYVLLSQFHMRDKDLIYVADARSVTLQKFLNLIAAMFTPLIPAAAISSAVP
jgi:polysaccharide export outer membrane protein